VPLATDSGSVELIVRSNSIIGDTLRLWLIEERNHLSHRIVTWPEPITIHQNDTIFFEISESLVGNHLLTIPEIVIFNHWGTDWGSHSPWSKISVERYSTDSSVIQIIDHYYSLYGDDTLKYFQSWGLTYRTWETQWVGTSFWRNILEVKQIGVPVLEVLNDSKLLPSFYLFQNFPNPFNPTTTIRYQIPTTELVKLKIYDLLGREMKTLVNEEKTVGNYEIEFDARELTSGIYFYRLQTGDFVQTKKMLLLK